MIMYTTASYFKQAAICLLALASLVKASAQSQDLCPEEIAVAYAALLSCPDSLAEARFFNAFPDHGEDFTLLYEPHDLTVGTALDLSGSSYCHTSAFWNLKQIPTEVLAEKAVRITCGLRFSQGASCHWQWYLRQALARPELRDVIADEVARLRSGHQLEFWAMVWSSAEADSCGLLFESLQPSLLTRHPHTASISACAFHLFHSEAGYEAMPNNGTWPGGYVQNLGYYMKEALISSSYPDSLSIDSNDSWFSDYFYSWDSGSEPWKIPEMVD